VKLHPADPFTRIASDTAVARRDVAAGLMVTCVAAAGTTAGAGWGLPLLLAAGVVTAALAGWLAWLRLREEECALELLIRGDEGIRAAAFDELRGRLLSARRRRALAASLERIRTARPRLLPGHGVARPLLDPSVIGAVDEELRRVIELLGGDRPGLQGVAKAQSLLAGPASPLFGTDARALREELVQTAFLLERDRSAG
jgi:hypothetical protein